MKEINQKMGHSTELMSNPSSPTPAPAPSGSGAASGSIGADDSTPPARSPMTSPGKKFLSSSLLILCVSLLRFSSAKGVH